MADDAPLVLSPEEMARYEAAKYLESQGVGGYTPARAPVSAEPPPPAPVSASPPPAPAPAPEAPSMWDNVKKGIKIAHGLDSVPPPAKKEAEQAKAPIGPPTAPASVDDPPLILPSRQGMGGVATPAGMYPESMTASVHQGREVPTETKALTAAGTAGQMRAADMHGDAEQQFYDDVRNAQRVRLQANDDAVRQHQLIAAEKQRIAEQRIGQIEQANSEANAAIDPEKLWHDKGAFARVIGAIATGLGAFAAGMRGTPNFAQQAIDAAVNREIEAQVTNRNLANQRANRMERLYDLHMSALGDKDKAIEATRLGLYENVNALIDEAAAKKGGPEALAYAMDLKSGLAQKYGARLNDFALQETDDIHKQATQRWHNATMVGGTGTPAGNMEGMALVPVPASDQTSERGQMIAVPKDVHSKLAGEVGAANTIIGINQDALARIKQIKDDTETLKTGNGDRDAAITRIRSNRATLEDLAQRKASYMSGAEGQGVLKEAEFARAMNDRVHFNDYWKAGDSVVKRIEAQNNGLAGAAGRMIQGAGGQRVQMAYTRDKNGALQPTPLYTGKPYVPPAVGPEMDPVTTPKGK